MKGIHDLHKSPSKMDSFPCYKPMFLSWCKSYKEEVSEMRELILYGSSDEKQLREEFKQLTGKRFKRRKGE